MTREYPTSIGDADADSIRLLGRDVTELMGSVGFGELAFRLVAMRRPTSGELRLFEAVLVALADHGLTPSAIAARLTLTGAPESIQGALAAGLLGGGSRFLGVTEDCGRFLAEALQGASQVPQVGHVPRVGEDPQDSGVSRTDEVSQVDDDRQVGPGQHVNDDPEMDALAREAVRTARRAGTPVPGLGHPLHKKGDPRTPVIMRIAREEGLYGPHLRLLEAVGRVHPEILGRTLPINGAGACGAALADLGFPVEVLRGFALLARAAGLLGHLAEELRRPVGMAIYQDVDRATRYSAPEG